MTTPTPEQIAQWREDSEFAYLKEKRPTHERRPSNFYADGYCRAKQETEQVMKLAKFGAMVLQTNGIFTDATEACVMEMLADICDLLVDKTSTLKPNIEATIKELLK